MVAHGSLVCGNCRAFACVRVRFRSDGGLVSRFLLASLLAVMVMVVHMMASSCCSCMAAAGCPCVPDL